MRRALTYILLAMLFVYCLFPFLWTVLTAVKPQEDVFKLPIRYLPERISLENLKNVFQKRPFARYILNSLVVAGGATLLTLGAASLVAFRLRRMEIERSLKIQRWLLIMAIVPPALLVIPVFMVMKKLELVNHYLGLILPYVLLNLPFAIWMLHAAFRQLPKELDEAAVLDGFSSIRILLGIILPLSRPVLAVAAILVFIFCWNEFILALALMPSQLCYTVPVGIAMLSGTSVYEIPWGEINAAVTLTTVPVILLIAFFQRWILEGLVRGAVKG
jgi:ABC-type glycerol-3-phosphate transport system permease component